MRTAESIFQDLKMELKLDRAKKPVGEKTNFQSPTVKAENAVRKRSWKERTAAADTPSESIPEF
jgi:hypothetical protein